MKPAFWKASTRSLLRECPCKSIAWLIAVAVPEPVTYCVMTDAKQSVLGLKSKCLFFFFLGGGGAGGCFSQLRN